MRLVVIAATGATGRLVLEQARAAGHEVVAVVRSPERLPAGVEAVRSDLSDPDPAALAAAFKGADAVVSALGATGRGTAGVATTGTGAVLDAMREAGVGRLVVLSAAPIGTVKTAVRPDKPRHDPGDGFVLRRLAVIVKRVLAEHYADLAAMEDLVRDSGLDWTVVRPPRLTDEAPRGRWRTALDANPRGGWTIGRADLAAAMLAALADRGQSRRVVAVAY
ncbi:NAD(P)-dependent oxidoreductase [Glycomyces paridis]|uniref:NAD-dependent epimerase/dehydratase family protein n=1 Tax=Glycomyces paridis TaxID=2126555 RepID=A0A4S8PD78_9ACTN|nr:NAD(P)H-binding protein [Glycomyces paridis]THV26224.1 NAD-dependent epimerase/dehydratase family protein [Glycomyces paridis]